MSYYIPIYCGFYIDHFWVFYWFPFKLVKKKEKIKNLVKILKKLFKIHIRLSKVLSIENYL